MPKFPKPIEELIVAFGTLPGVGPKTAERYAFTLLKRPRAERERLAAAILAAASALRACSLCRNYTQADPCAICSDPTRDRETVCVVANEQDLLAVEHTDEYRGLYHILGGTLSPADGILPADLTVSELVRRVQERSPREIILALDPTIEGESTMLYLSRLLGPLGPKVTRLARGLPIGSELGYADEVTITDALKGRREMAGAVPAQALTQTPAASQTPTTAQTAEPEKVPF